MALSVWKRRSAYSHRYAATLDARAAIYGGDAMSGTELPYAALSPYAVAMLCTTLSYHMVLRDIRF
eukprot:2647515-Rhodomonas_salina.1